MGEEDGYLHRRGEKDMHKLTTAEVVGLVSLSGVAAEYDAIAAPTDAEQTLE
jgi:hypothetical protein